MTRRQNQGEIIVTLSSDEKHYSFDQMSVDFNASDQEILDALAPRLLEEEGFDIRENVDDDAFTIKRVEATGNVFIFPNTGSVCFVAEYHPFCNSNGTSAGIPL